MASAHQADGGVLTVSVDLDLGVDLATFEQARALDATTDRLLLMFDDLGIAATWSVADPAQSRWTERLTSAGEKHEVAVVGEASWADGQASRRLFVRQLQQHVLSSRAAGLAATTFVFRGELPPEYLDVLVKHGVTAVCGRTAGTSRIASHGRPRPLRFGVWKMPSGFVLPGESRWLSGGGRGRRAARGIDRAVGCGFFHLVIDAPQLAERGRSAERLVERVLRRSERLRAESELRLETLSQSAARLNAAPAAVPARSILRPAA